MPESSPLALALSNRLERFRQTEKSAGRDPISIETVAAKLETSRAAVYMWLKGDRLPKPSHLTELASMFAADDDEQEVIHSEFLMALEAQSKRRDIAPPSFLVSSDIADRIGLASDLWVLKWQKRFRSGSDAFLYRQIESLVRDDLPTGHPKFHYVFPSNEVAREVAALTNDGIDRDDLAASRSFDDLRDQLKRTFPGKNIDSLIVGHMIESLGDVLRLRLPRAEMIGYFMIEYNAKGYEKYDRLADVFVEIDARPIVREVGTRDVIGPQTYWVALPAESAEEMRSDWKTVIATVDELKTTESIETKAAA